ncbi:oxidoreductase [Phellopilus nigrolimitatus]|nr:oxidoreductase [Phellopilus nigrolimitatus]
MFASTHLLAAVASLLIVVVTPLMFFSKKKWDPKGQHCYVTGGSSGLGLSLAISLVRLGADVSIVARDAKRLENALSELESARQSPNQILRSYSYSLYESGPSTAALEAACEPHNRRCPDAVFLCAGTSTPRFYIEGDEQTFKKGMDDAYWVQAWSALAAVKLMVRDKVKGKIVFISSYLGYMSMVGFSSYAPGKHALRGLAETLRSELLLYSISVHIQFPGTIQTPGYIEENKTKPKIVLKLEEAGGPGVTADQAAASLLCGVRRGDFHVTGDLLGNIFRSSTRGATPHNNVFFDGLYSLAGWIGLAFWRHGVDSEIIKHRREHEKYLVEKGFLDVKNASISG